MDSTKIKEIGTVIKENGDKLTVRILRQEKCNGCKGCAMGKKHLDVVVSSALEVKVGDSVEVEFAPSGDKIFALIVYLFPMLLLGLGLGLGIGIKLPELYTALLGFGLLSVGLIAAYFIDKRRSKKKNLNPKIIAKIDKKGV